MDVEDVWTKREFATTTETIEKLKRAIAGKADALASLLLRNSVGYRSDIINIWYAYTLRTTKSCSFYTHFHPSNGEWQFFGHLWPSTAQKSYQTSCVCVRVGGGPAQQHFQSEISSVRVDHICHTACFTAQTNLHRSARADATRWIKRNPSEKATNIDVARIQSLGRNHFQLFLHSLSILWSWSTYAWAIRRRSNVV